MSRIFQLLSLFSILFGLAACSSTEVDSGEVKGAAQETGGEYSLNQKNPFEWSADDVKTSANGAYQKRSQFDRQEGSTYAKSRKTPGYLSREYQSAAWNGKKDYSAGSYKSGTKTSKAGKKSWFGWKKNKDANKVAGASGQNFRTGNYTTASARESGNIVASPNSNYAAYRQRIGTKPMIIYTQENYRKMSMDQSRSLLGKR